MRPLLQQESKADYLEGNLTIIPVPWSYRPSFCVILQPSYGYHASRAGLRFGVPSRSGCAHATLCAGGRLAVLPKLFLLASPRSWLLAGLTPALLRPLSIRSSSRPASSPLSCLSASASAARSAACAWREDSAQGRSRASAPAGGACARAPSQHALE